MALDRADGSPAKAPLRILHLEDDPDDAFLIENALVSDFADVQVLRARDRIEFLEAIKESSFDVILADSGVPCFSGLDALKIARQEYAAVPFICVSGLADEKHIKASLEAGATEYVSKDHLWKLPAAIRLAIDLRG